MHVPSIHHDRLNEKHFSTLTSTNYIARYESNIYILFLNANKKPNLKFLFFAKINYYQRLLMCINEFRNFGNAISIKHLTSFYRTFFCLLFRFIVNQTRKHFRADIPATHVAKIKQCRTGKIRWMLVPVTRVCYQFSYEFFFFLFLTRSVLIFYQHTRKSIIINHNWRVSELAFFLQKQNGGRELNDYSGIMLRESQQWNEWRHVTRWMASSEWW